MSNTDTAPAEVDCAASPFAGVLHPREVPLGGPRAIRVRRTLPQRERSLIGAWCFADHYGPHDVRGGTGMDVPPHPHTGLQTVSWLFSGEVEHRDSAGVHAMVRPGELNLMTAGAGICHSEVSTSATTVLHGAQLWVALPDSDRDTDRDFAHFAPSPQSLGDATLRVFLGELAGAHSPVHTFTPLLGAQLDLDPGADLTLDIDRTFEHGVLLDQGSVEVAGTALDVADLAFQAAGLRPAEHRQPRRGSRARAAARRHAVSRTAGDVVELRRPQPRRHRDVPPAVGGPRRPLRGGRGLPRRDTRLPAPPLPNATLRPRPNPGV